jgi:hypothetical protein
VLKLTFKALLLSSLITHTAFSMNSTSDLKILDISLGKNATLPCNISLTKKSASENVILNQCEIKTEDGTLRIVTSSDRSSVVYVIRKQYLRLPNEGNTSSPGAIDVIAKLIKKYGKPDWGGYNQASYGLSKAKSSGGINEEDENTGVGLFVYSRDCSFMCPNGFGKSDSTIEYILVNSRAYAAVIKEGESRFKSQKQKSIESMKF